MYIKVSVNKPNKVSPGAPAPRQAKIVLLDVDDLLVPAPRTAKNILITGNHILKTGAYAIEVYATVDKIHTKVVADGEADGEAVTQELKFSHPGSELEIIEFRQNWLGRSCLAFLKVCGSDIYKQLGDVCAPLRMRYEAIDNKDNDTTNFEFRNLLKGPDIAIYTGTLDVFGTSTFDQTFDITFS